ncbi:MAG: hypothetical protein ACD_39C00609G0002 [uncultured bacterium]|nr:MAG: hypothetical protein ACD_39C00609G0002 [uncultured bacterium]
MTPVQEQKNWKVLLAVLIVAVLMPVSVFTAGFSYYVSAKHELEEAGFLSIAEPAALSLPHYLDNKTFWGNELSRMSLNNSEMADFEAAIRGMAENHQQKLGYILWAPDGSIFSSNFVAGKDREKWLKAGQIVRKQLLPYQGASFQEEFFMRKLLGRHFAIRKIRQTMHTVNSRLLESDFDNRHPLIWANAGDFYTAMVLLPPSVSRKDHGLKTMTAHLVKKLPADCTFALLSGDKILANRPCTPGEMLQIEDSLLLSRKKVVRSGKLLIFGERLEDGSFFAVFRPVGSLTSAKIEGLFALGLLFFYLLIAKTFALNSFALKSGISRIIYTFIGLSNLLPLCLLAFFVAQYLDQKYVVMIDEKRAESVRYIHLLEQELLNETNRAPGQVKALIASFTDVLKKESLTLAVARQLHQKLYDNKYTFCIVASDSNVFLTDSDYIRNNETTRLRMRRDRHETRKQEELYFKLGICYLAYWNRTNVSEKLLTEVELVTDTFLQRPLAESLHMFVEVNDRLGNFGYGRSAIPSFSSILALFAPDIADYFVFCMISQEATALNFLQNKNRERMHNSYGLKVIYSRKSSLFTDGLIPFVGNEKIASVVARAPDYPPLSAEILRIDGSDYVCTAYESPIVTRNVLVALFPLAEIEERLRVERNDLLLLLLSNLLIVLAISFFFSNMLLSPVKWLDKAAKAIDERNFAYRLPNLGNDEMGKMAHIFNETLADLEEISLARVVQQQLFPTAAIDTGPFDMYGKSVTLADLGGDYLDYFAVDHDSFAAIIGDVAGHGVGAAMIMTMAKSATLNSAAYYKSPASFVMRLNEVILNTRTKQHRKIMTFQYLHADKLHRTVKFSNAGGCNPFLVNRAKGKIEEIVLPAPPLGAFKKSVFREVEIRFAPEDVLVLYSDGIVEARNAEGQEIGYPRFMQMLTDNWSPDCRAFYEAVFSEYSAWIGKEPAQDDLTMIFLSLKQDQPQAGSGF